MAGKPSEAPGRVIRTYGRLQPVRKLQQQRWLSPTTDHKHLFSSSSSSSHLSSPTNVSPSDDSDFLPTKRRKKAVGKKRLKPPEKAAASRKKRKKKLQKSPERSSDKENEALPDRSSDTPLIFTTPFRKFVTFRRKAPPRSMKPPSAKPKREAHIPFSSDSFCDFEVKRRKLRSEVCVVLDSSSDALPTPLHKAPLLSSTPSVQLTAMPRTESSFVRQLALCGPLEDSVVRCCSEVPGEEDLLHEDLGRHRVHSIDSPQQGSEVRRARVHSIDSPQQGSEVRRARVQSIASPQQGSEVRRARVQSIASPQQGSEVTRNGSGSGVKCLSIKMSPGRSPLCLLSPVSMKSSDSVIFVDEKPMQRDFCASPELFSDHSTMLGSRFSSAITGGLSADKWKYFRRKSFQPVVRLYSDAVAEYLQRQTKLLQEERPPVSTLRSLSHMQPIVQLDPHAVTRYYQERNVVTTPNLKPSPRAKDLTSPEATMQTPLVAASIPKIHIQTSAAPTETTGRKVCISGFSVKRWGNFRKKSSRAQQQLSFLDYGSTPLFRGKEDVSHCAALSPLHFSPSLMTSSFLNSSAARNLDLSTESFSIRDPHKEHQRWVRLRAALSLHRKKKVEAGLPSSHSAARRFGNQSAHGNYSSLLLLSPSSLCCDELTDAEKVLAECQQEKPITFQQCLTQDQLDGCHKVGEGVYGEVFRTLRGDQLVALKIIPIEGSQKVNGEHQKSFAEILPEIIISKELSLLSGGENNITSGFIKLHSAYCVKGSYPSELLAAWDEFADEKGTENERPDLFGADQLFMILEFEFGGDDLERVSSQLPSVSASRSILHQVTAALAVAEEELRFEHRDLHWGNLLIEACEARSLSASIRGKTYQIPTAGVRVKIIDYTLSRLDKDGLTVFCDLSSDEDLFLGEGDLQFDVYRKMREENQNSWSLYRPHSNVLWLHYLCDKLLSEVQYVRKPSSAAHQKELRRLRDFRREVQKFNSATDILQRSKLFN